MLAMLVMVGMIMIMAIVNSMNQLVPRAIAIEDTDADEDPCQRVKVFKHNGVQAVGELENSLVLITDNWYVFEVPREALQSDLGKFYLNVKPPIKTSEKWPELWQNEQFQKIKNESKLAQSYVDSSRGQDDIRFETIELKTDDPGVNFIVNKRQVEIGARLWNLPRPYVMMGVSGSNTKYLYAFQRQEDGSIQISAWSWFGVKFKWWELSLYPGYPVCASDKPNHLFVRFNNEDCDRNIDWPEVYHGFVGGADHKFYLFAESYVLIFDDSLFDFSCAEQKCDGPNTRYRKIDYNAFIQCDGVVASVSPSAINEASGIGWGIWLAIILGILLLLLCCLLSILRFAFYEDKKDKDKNAGKSANISLRSRISGGGGFGIVSLSPRSMREALSSRFAMLTAFGHSRNHSNTNSLITARSKMDPSKLTKLSRKHSSGSLAIQGGTSARSSPMKSRIQKKSRITTKTGLPR